MKAVAASPPRRASAGGIARRLGLDWFELLMLVVLAGVSMAVLLPLALQGRPLSGVEGLFPPDQFQYFAWIREAAHHGLIGNRFDLAPGERPFLHPGFGLSGLVHNVTGLSIPLSYLLWKPVAVVVTFVGCLLYVRRLLPPGGQQRVALVIALFSVMPTVAVVAWSDWGGNPRQYMFDFISGEMWSGQYLWGYLMTGIAVFTMPLVLLGLESWRASRRPLTLALCALGALVVFWLQPWQGGTLLLIVAVVEALRFWRTRERPPAALLAVFAAGSAPAIYYLILSRTDSAWKLASESNAAGVQPLWSWPWWAIALTVMWLVVPAALAYRLPAPTWQEQAVRVWPFAAAVVYLAPFGTFPYHAIQGLALPLGILAVQGVASVARPRPALVVAALVLLTVPGFAHKLELPRNSIHDNIYPYYLLEGERQALDALERDPRPGGVLAAEYGANLVPYRTGRESYLGALSWTPDFPQRLRRSNHLFEGRLTGAAARGFVRESRARFLFASCRPSADLRPVLGSMLRSARQFGCATLYELHERPEMARAAGAPDE
ncbi:MAG TPA: hypothetical protein VFQ12_02040 [Thermoleophilaceae bacterium]|nr:hypothetical protein [Thermoleophilaceae bacterium]